MKVRKIAILAITLCLGLVMAASAWASPSQPQAKIDPAVTAAIETWGAEQPVAVIIYAPGHVDDVVANLPMGYDCTALPLVKGVAVELNAAQIATVAALPCVRVVASDAPVMATDYAGSMDVTNYAIGLADVAPPAAGGPTGTGATVAIVDSGVADHVDLQKPDGTSRVVAWVDFVKGKKHPYDDAGHGTFVAGLIAGDGDASLPLDEGGRATQQFRGVAPDASIAALKVLDEYGQGRASDVVAAIQWAITHKDEFNIRVLNLSVGGDIPGPTVDDPMAQAVEAAWNAGIVVVCAAGNEGAFGQGGVLSPGNDPYVITVGALDTRQTKDGADDVVCDYSSQGPTLLDEFAKPDVVAPGNRLVSLRVKASFIDRHWPENRIAVETYVPDAPPTMKPSYYKLSGTSTAAPVVAGLAALMVAEDPSLTPDDVKVRLMATADPVAGCSSFAQGAGLVDAPGALTSDLRAQGPALSADLGDGDTILPPDVLVRWAKYSWTKYSWTKYSWTKYSWTKYSWTKYSWTKYSWTKYSWTKYSWTTMIAGQ